MACLPFVLFSAPFVFLGVSRQGAGEQELLTMPATPETETAARTIAFRVPERIERELEASRSARQPLSATVRRLVSLGLDNDCRSLDRGGR